MRASTAILALAGSALAAPSWNQPEYKEVKNVHVVYETVVHTVFYTEGQQKPKHSKTPTSSYEAPAVTTTVVYEESTPVATSVAAPTSTVVVEYSQAPAPTSTEAAATSSAAAPSSTATGYQAIVDEWRSKLGLKALANDAKLESNAMDTVVSSNGQMVHKLNPGTYGQVLAPGNADDFEHVFVGGWLCEIPTLPGLDGICATQSQGWSYEGQTGHAEILTSTSYSKIGCALYAGIWCCDLA